VLDAYKISSDIIRVSYELLQDSGFDMDAIIGEAFGERLGRKSNGFLTTGTGSSQPNGIVTAAALGKTAASATAITWDEIFDLFHSVDPAYRGSPKARFMFNDATLLVLRKLKDGDGNYLWQESNARTGEPATISGKPYSINQAMDSIATGNRTVVFGDFSKYIVRKAAGMQMLRLVERYGEFWQVGFIAMNRIDGELLDTAAVKHLIQA
jgi:HK97 family phage major capsid protein